MEALLVDMIDVYTKKMKMHWNVMRCGSVWFRMIFDSSKA